MAQRLRYEDLFNKIDTEPKPAPLYADIPPNDREQASSVYNEDQIRQWILYHNPEYEGHTAIDGAKVNEEDPLRKKRRVEPEEAPDTQTTTAPVDTESLISDLARKILAPQANALANNPAFTQHTVNAQKNKLNMLNASASGNPSRHFVNHLTMMWTKSEGSVEKTVNELSQSIDLLFSYHSSAQNQGHNPAWWKAVVESKLDLLNKVKENFDTIATQNDLRNYAALKNGNSTDSADWAPLLSKWFGINKHILVLWIKAQTHHIGIDLIRSLVEDKCQPVAFANLAPWQATYYIKCFDDLVEEIAKKKAAKKSARSLNDDLEDVANGTAAKKDKSSSNKEGNGFRKHRKGGRR